MNSRYLLYVAQNKEGNPYKRIAAYQLYMGKVVGHVLEYLMDTFYMTIEEARECLPEESALA